MKGLIICALVAVATGAFAQTSPAPKEKKTAKPAPSKTKHTAEVKGLKTTPTGLKYKFYVDKPGKTALIGEILVFDMLLETNKDSVLRNTFKEGNPVQALVQASTYKGSLEEAFLMLSPGDSALFLINADSLFAKSIKQPLPPFIEQGSNLKFILKAKKVTTPDELKKEQEMAEQKQIEQYIAENKLQAQKTASGLYYVVKEQGTGKQAMPGDTVQVHYTGKLVNGKVFDSSVQRGVPFEFTLGRGMVIHGWDEGIALMKVGGKGTLLIPSALGYGARGAGAAIPPNSVLIFDVELVGTK